MSKITLKQKNLLIMRTSRIGGRDAAIATSVRQDWVALGFARKLMDAECGNPPCNIVSHARGLHGNYSVHLPRNFSRNSSAINKTPKITRYTFSRF